MVVDWRGIEVREKRMKWEIRVLEQWKSSGPPEKMPVPAKVLVRVVVCRSRGGC